MNCGNESKEHGQVLVNELPAWIEYTESENDENLDYPNSSSSDSEDDEWERFRAVNPRAAFHFDFHYGNQESGAISSTSQESFDEEDSNINDESDLGEIDEIFEDDDDDLGNQFMEQDEDQDNNQATSEIETMDEAKSKSF